MDSLDSFVCEWCQCDTYIPKQIKKFIDNRNIITNIYRRQSMIR